ncbi:MAG: exosortase [Alcanivoracaceae bacterium]
MPSRSALIFLLLPVVALLTLLWLSGPTWHAVAAGWFDDGTYSHGLLLVLVCCWLIWRDARRSRWPSPAPDWRWLPLLLLMSALFQLALVASVDLLQRLLLLPLFLSMVAALAGSAWARPLLFPAIMLSLAIPLWGLLISPLQTLAVWATGGLLGWLDIPAAIHATHIRIAAGTFEVSEGCSGLRYLLVAAAITLLWGKLYLRDWRVSLIYLGIGVMAALLTNWIRILGLILIGHHTEMQHPLMEDHNNFGWYIFVVMLIPLFWIGRQLPHRDKARTTTTPIAAITHPLPLLTPWLVLLALWLPALSLKTSADSRLVHPPAPAEGWQIGAPEGGRWRPGFVGADQQWHLLYRHTDGADLALHLDWFASQRTGTELLGQGNQARRSGWPLRPLQGECPAGMACGELTDQQGERVLIYGLLVNGSLTSSLWQAKLGQLLAPLYQRPGAALIAFERGCASDCRQALQDLIHDSAPLRNDLWTQLNVRD